MLKAKQGISLGLYNYLAKEIEVKEHPKPLTPNTSKTLNTSFQGLTELRVLAKVDLRINRGSPLVRSPLAHEEVQPESRRFKGFSCMFFALRFLFGGGGLGITCDPKPYKIVGYDP